MDIRQMCEADVSAVAEIELQSLSPWTSSSLNEELSRQHGLQYLFIDNKKIVAWAALQVLGSEAEILKIAVSSVYRRRGIALHFWQRIQAEISLRGVTEVFLEVREANMPARNLYEKIGFEQVGLRKKYYQNPVDNALVFKLNVVCS